MDGSLVWALRVIDGDSVLVVDAEGGKSEVRLYGIDAPELFQPHGPESADALGRMLGHESFWLEDFGPDRYDRVVGLLFHRGQHRRNSVNLRMVREGHAYAYTQYGGLELGFHAAERNATESRVGIWLDSRRGGERPWDYRARVRGRAQGPGDWRRLLFSGIFALLSVLLAVALFVLKRSRRR